MLSLAQAPLYFSGTYQLYNISLRCREGSIQRILSRWIPFVTPRSVSYDAFERQIKQFALNTPVKVEYELHHRQSLEWPFESTQRNAPKLLVTVQPATGQSNNNDGQGWQRLTETQADLQMEDWFRQQGLHYNKIKATDTTPAGVTVDVNSTLTC